MKDPESIKNQHENLLAEHKRAKTRLTRFSGKDKNNGKFLDLANKYEDIKNKLHKFYYKFGAFMKIRKNGMGRFDIEKYKKSLEDSKNNAEDTKATGNEFLNNYLQTIKQKNDIKMQAKSVDKPVYEQNTNGIGNFNAINNNFEMSHSKQQAGYNYNVGNETRQNQKNNYEHNNESNFYSQINNVDAQHIVYNTALQQNNNINHFIKNTTNKESNVSPTTYTKFDQK
ncbi:hypothetical protein BDAP_002515 [Binucleata daphniae]